MSDCSEKCQPLKSSIITQRWVTVCLGFLGILNAYSMRVCLSIAITEMTYAQNNTVIVNPDETCTANYSHNDAHMGFSKRSSGVKYDWSEHTQGLILSSFYWGYVFSCVLGGVICQNLGGKHTLGLSILLTSLFTLLTPICTYWGDSTALIILRVIMGLGQGTTYPAISDLLAKWIPQNERSQAGALAFSGGSLGTIFGMLISGVILRNTKSGWPAVFYFHGIVGLISFLLNTAFCYNRPIENPYVTDQELKYLEKELKNTYTDLPPIPWLYILKSPAIWALIAANFGNACGFFIIVSDMPKYMSSVLKFSAQENGFFSSIPHLSMLIGGILTCWLADKAINEGIMTITAVRKIGCTVSLTGPATFLVAASYAGCDGFLVIALQSAGLALMGCSSFSSAINAVDLSPNYASSITGLVSGLSVIAGALFPCIVGVMTPSQTMSEWRSVFWIVFVIFVMSNLIYLICGNGRVQEWNNPGFLNKNTFNLDDVKEGVELLNVNKQ